METLFFFFAPPFVTVKLHQHQGPPGPPPSNSTTINVLKYLIDDIKGRSFVNRIILIPIF